MLQLAACLHLSYHLVQYRPIKRPTFSCSQSSLLVHSNFSFRGLARCLHLNCLCFLCLNCGWVVLWQMLSSRFFSRWKEKTWPRPWATPVLEGEFSKRGPCCRTKVLGETNMEPARRFFGRGRAGPGALNSLIAYYSDIVRSIVASWFNIVRYSTKSCFIIMIVYQQHDHDHIDNLHRHHGVLCWTFLCAVGRGENGRAPRQSTRSWRDAIQQYTTKNLVGEI